MTTDDTGWIRELRQELNVSQEKFAAIIGVSLRTVNRWENGQAKPSPLAMEKIASIQQTLPRSSPVKVQS